MRNGSASTISLLDHCYWILGSCVGALAGKVSCQSTLRELSFFHDGIIHSYSSQQWMDTKEHKPAVIGGVVGVLCLLVLGADTIFITCIDHCRNHIIRS